MDKRNHHANLHLQRVLKVHAILSHAPVSLQDSQVAPADYLHAEELVVDEAAVDAHQGHEVKDGPELEEGCEGEEHESVAHVAEHHAEENGDRAEHEDRGKDLVVFWSGVELS